MKEIIILAFLAAQFITTVPPTTTARLDFRPPGTVEIVDNFFMDEVEVSNKNWREYLEILKRNYGEESELYLQAIPDTEVWLKNGLLSQPYVDTYLYHPAYEDYPVVGISYEQAIKFCKWRTKAVKKMIKENDFYCPKNFMYRLPTQTEWELVANAGYNNQQIRQINKQRKKYGENTRLCNMNFGNLENGPAPTRAYLPNKYGIYNIYGNVAEFVAEPGIAMGGSFTHLFKEIVPTNNPISYSEPQYWLGLRCVCEIIEE